MWGMQSAPRSLARSVHDDKRRLSAGKLPSPGKAGATAVATFSILITKLGGYGLI